MDAEAYLCIIGALVGVVNSASTPTDGLAVSAATTAGDGLAVSDAKAPLMLVSLRRRGLVGASGLFE